MLRDRLSRSPQPITVLVVDDDRDLRRCMAEALQALGHRVATAADGRAALAILRRGCIPCLVLLDLIMPNMNGWQFLEERKKNPELLAIPVVVVSGEADAERLDSSLGVAGRVTKPISNEQLATLVKRFEGRRG